MRARLNIEDGLITEEPMPDLPKEGSLASGGQHGEIDPEAMAWRKRRTNGIRNRDNYHQIVPCDKCVNCLEVRRFKATGEAVTIGFFCIHQDEEVDQYHTCDFGKERRRRYSRVIYDTTRAPAGFELGLAAKSLKPAALTEAPLPDSQTQSVVAEAAEYHGGGKQYRRKDGDAEAIGSGKIPKGLGN